MVALGSGVFSSNLSWFHFSAEDHVFNRSRSRFLIEIVLSVTSFVLLWIRQQSSLISVFSDTYSVWRMSIQCMRLATAGLVIFGSIVCLSVWATSCGYEGLLCWLGWKLNRIFFCAGIYAWWMHSVFGLLLQLCIFLSVKKFQGKQKTFLFVLLLAITRLQLLYRHCGLIFMFSDDITEISWVGWGSN